MRMSARRTSTSDEVTVLVERIRADVVPDGEAFVTPAGYAQISLALVDAVYSIRARYSGVESVVRAFAAATGTPTGQGLNAREEPGFREHRLAELIAAANGLARTELANHLFGGNHSKTSGRLKADVCVDVARRLVDAGIETGRDLDLLAAQADTWKAWTGVHGLGWITWQYFCLMNGIDGMKPDVMLTRFVSKTLDRDVNACETNDLLTEAYERMNDPHGTGNETGFRPHHLALPIRKTWSLTTFAREGLCPASRWHHMLTDPRHRPVALCSRGIRRSPGQ